MPSYLGGKRRLCPVIFREIDRVVPRRTWATLCFLDAFLGGGSVALYAKAQELHIPVMIHTGSSVFKGARLKYGDPLHLDDVAVDFPDLTLLMVHSGRGFWYDRAFSLTILHANLYMEIAGLPPHKLLDYFPELERVADKVIFGSDFPGVPDIGRNIEAIRGLPLQAETKEKILGGNAARILGMDTDR